MNEEKNISRRQSRRIYVGNVPIGDNAPISVQSMTNTKTIDIVNTIHQIKQLKNAGADLVRISIPDMASAEAFKIIKKRVNIPLIADIHFNYQIALKVAEYGADCLRINPGNIGNINHIKQVVSCAREKNIPIRLGINSGSLEKDLQKKYGNYPNSQALLESAMRQIDYFDNLNFYQFKVSIKSSDVLITIEACRLLSKKIDQPLHLGVTEAGGLNSGIVKSAIGIGTLLLEGIGDTIRVSLTDNPIQEIKIGFDILRALKVRFRGINFIACPTCSRQEFDVINTLKYLENKLEDIITPLNISIIGCIVNGIGEAKNADIGIVGGKKFSRIYENGSPKNERIKNKNILKEIEELVRNKIK
ncbi:flavodoxin-dependent (E)-4-hydroxy-3-methylbut-2-enyl-diphosphate synthase [Candidatus Tachikawaea gelatinosa]|uniref:4-hydroxy-3-methylbut-2-en-1-yl diphosphate synthase (flavodoxin) n=1 Tax=Candidatus Tachikawaea gelatinosa TaxID=1410383 RepID=A0A090ARM1_9ENTR|nr:flavodoxin-dependent (E)-4-hydroxy-3-methylbut-2-enyl-diphosphate synthase [Candidatus Tachikawaea gelatinosa]BAP58445.1 4-hydroxy-3-methylbut-2-en-1-yl diphosphate synthase [Candidatus Tachikawaea gelatinosa]